MSQEGEIVRIMEQELGKHGFTTSNHDEGSKRVLVVEDHKKGTVTKVTLEPYVPRREKK